MSASARLGARARLTVSANLTNLFDEGTATDPRAKLSFSTQAITVDETQFYWTGVDTEALIAGPALVRDAWILMDSEFQAPRPMRPGLRVGS